MNDFYLYDYYYWLLFYVLTMFFCDYVRPRWAEAAVCSFSGYDIE